MNGRRSVVESLEAAVQGLSPARKARAMALFEAAHRQVLAMKASPRTPPPALVPVELSLAYSAVNGDPDGLLAEAAGLAERGLSVVFGVNADGAICGTGKYQSLDVDGLYIPLAWVAFAEVTPPAFVPTGQSPVTLSIPDTAVIGLLGDWGTGTWGSSPSPALQNAEVIRSAIRPDYLVHLGDVYYAGTDGTGPLGHVWEPYQQTNFLGCWPSGRWTSLALDSNHDMYAAGTGYFNETLGRSPARAGDRTPFTSQNGLGFFALENDHWIVLGLDSGYFAKWDDLYMNGAIAPAGQGSVQTEFIASFAGRVASRANPGGKGLIVLTHHNPLATDGSQPDPSQVPLLQQVAAPLPDGASIYWYWGHLHAAAVYRPRAVTDPTTGATVTVQGRCVGHGGIPWGIATALQSAGVLWYETRLMKDATAPNWPVVNGCAGLRLRGPELQEAIYDQYGEVRWASNVSLQWRQQK